MEQGSQVQFDLLNLLKARLQLCWLCGATALMDIYFFFYTPANLIQLRHSELLRIFSCILVCHRVNCILMEISHGWFKVLFVQSAFYFLNLSSVVFFASSHDLENPHCVFLFTIFPFT